MTNRCRLSGWSPHDFFLTVTHIPVKIFMIIGTVTPKTPITSVVDSYQTPSLTTSSVPVSSGSENTSGVLLSNLWTQLDHIQSTIPDRLSVAMLESAGVQMENSDPRLARLISLAGQKFLTDILSDAMLHWRLANGQPTGLLNHPSVSTSIPGQASNPSSINPITTPTSNPSQSIPQSPSSNQILPACLHCLEADKSKLIFRTDRHQIRQDFWSPTDQL
ncbi:unnamed protein product [Schistosoma intercalatum]|nr:unnamed protein product [Schistosoma intercalatum]CAH8650137.1 unnamed protein product [Schistosoma intercalatum]